TVNRDAAVLDIVEALQKREERGFATAGMADEADPLAGLDAQAELVEHLHSSRIAERDVVERDRGSVLDQRLGLGVILQLMRQQQRGNRFRQTGDMLGDID